MKSYFNHPKLNLSYCKLITITNSIPYLFVWLFEHYYELLAKFVCTALIFFSLKFTQTLNVHICPLLVR